MMSLFLNKTQTQMENVEFGNKFKAACDGCRKQKVRCDRITPHCSVCQRRGIACVWPKATGRQSDMKRFYDSASSSIHMFKCVKEITRPVKKQRTKHKTTTKLIKSTIEPTKLPDLTDDSGQESIISSSPIFSQPETTLTNEFFPLCSAVSLPRPSMETMVDNFDRILIFDLLEKHGMGKVTNKSGSFFKPKYFLGPNRNSKVHIKGLDLNPYYDEILSDYGALSSILEIHLINLFFNQINTFFPLIHRGKFFASLKSPSTRPNNFLLNAIYYVACPFLPFNPKYFSGCPFKLAQIYHQEAMKQLDENISKPSIMALQAIFLLYNGECAMVDKLNAFQYKMVGQLQLDNLDLSSLSEEDKEESLNLLWCCYLQDKICNLTRCRKFSLSRDRFSLHLPYSLELPVLTELFPLPGASHCQLAFIGSVKLAIIVEDLQTCFSLYSQASPHVLLSLVANYEKQFLAVLSELGPKFECNDLHTYSAMALVLFRLFFHMSHIHLYLLAISLLPSLHSNPIFILQHKAIQSACAITFLTESLNVDFFKFGSLLKVNSTMLAFIVHRIALRLPLPLYENLGGFGKERAIITNFRNVNHRLGLELSFQELEKLMIEFCSPPSTNPLRNDLFI